jgi:hypothetical protein
VSVLWEEPFIVQFFQNKSFPKETIVKLVLKP